MRVLRRDAAYIDYPSRFTIYDQGDAVRLCGYVLRDLNLDHKRFPPRSIHAAISAANDEPCLGGRVVGEHSEQLGEGQSLAVVLAWCIVCHGTTVRRGVTRG